MVEFRPFRGIRYAFAPPGEPADISAVAAPPYDVIDEERRESLEAQDPRNSVRLILPRDASDGTDRYRTAAALIEDWTQRGVLAVDSAERFYRYRMTFADGHGGVRSTGGVLGALRLPERDAPAEDPSVLPHERTLPKAKSDRLALLRATRANLDPIWGLSLTPGLSSVLESGSQLLAHCVDHEGVRHELFALGGAGEIAAVTAAVGESAVVLADGHHRFETAGNYRDERRTAGIQDPGADFIMALVVELADDQLCVGPIHRLLRGVGQVDLPSVLSRTCDTVPVGANTPENVAALEERMRTDDGLGLVERAGLTLLLPRRDAINPDLDQLPAELRDVDSARFEVAVRPAIGDAEVTFRDDAAAVASLVEKGAADAAVLLRPVTVAQIRAAAFADVRMPEKTTFFQPKPRTGFVFRSLDR